MKNTAEDNVKLQANAGKAISGYFCKMKGGRCSNLSRLPARELLTTALGSLAGIGLVGVLSNHYQLPLLFPSFGASAVLLYAACHAPMAQPRNVAGGHILSALVGVTAYRLLGSEWWAVAIGVTAAILVMAVTHTLHPPGGATAFVAVYSGQDFGFVLSPVALGVLCLIAIALLVNNLSPQRKYPEYWY
ncbi:MAG: HPP family protein [Peptococcaceae bacterium]|nr:HPP family protein [Peptococcaceae bacterium]